MSVAAAQEVNAKCRAMYARLLKRADYERLLSMKSVSQIGVYLKKQTPYAYVMRRIDENDIHRGQLEQVFKRSLFYDYERLMKFMRDGCRTAVRAMFESHEIDDLKLAIGSICSDHEQFISEEDLSFVSNYSEFPADAVIGADTMDKLVANLRHTRYYKPLLPFASAESPEYIKIDRALNLLNYQVKMKAFMNAPGGANRQIAVSQYGARVDIDNILYIYRIKRLHSLPAADIMSYLMPCRHMISSRELYEMAECGSHEELTALIGRTKYGRLFPKGREDEWETLHSEHFYQMNKMNIRRQDAEMGVALAYLYLKEVDIRNIIMIIEGVRYSLPAAKIASFLIGCGRAA